MRGARAQEITDDANMKPERVTCLDIRDNRVELLPHALAQLLNLTELHAANNHLKNIPSAIGRLNDLKSAPQPSVPHATSVQQLHLAEQHDKRQTGDARLGSVLSVSDGSAGSLSRTAAACARC